MSKPILQKTFIPPSVIFEDADCLVVNKPAGLIVHGGPQITETTLADWLVKQYPSIKDVGEDPLRPGIVHRLDKEVSGLMVIAKNQASFQHLKSLFQEREIIKQYLALVHGAIETDQGEINFPIKRASTGHRMAALPANLEKLWDRPRPKNRDQGNLDAQLQARPASTEFKVLKKLVNYTFLEVKIKTGRTHQIRVHFFAYGHPLVGDDLYSTKRAKARNQKLNLGRIFLVSSRLSFKNQAGQKLDFSLDLPAELKNFLDKLA